MKCASVGEHGCRGCIEFEEDKQFSHHQKIKNLSEKDFEDVYIYMVVIKQKLQRGLCMVLQRIGQSSKRCPMSSIPSLVGHIGFTESLKWCLKL